MDPENESFWPNIRRYLSLPASQQSAATKPNPECTICLASTLKCYPLNNHGATAIKDSEGNDLERMVILWCGHVVGYDCITDYMTTCYANYSESGLEQDLPRCPQCRESLTKDCEAPYFEGDVDQDRYQFMIPFVIAPAGPPVPGGPSDNGENFDESSPMHFNILDEGQLQPIAFSFDRWQDIPLTRGEGGVLPASCRSCNPELYRAAYRQYREQRQPVKVVMNNTLYATKGAPRLVPAPRSSIFQAPPNRPSHNIWKLGFCVMAQVPMKDGTDNWEHRRMRVAAKMMYFATMSDGTPVEIPLEPRCLGPPTWGPIRFGRHPGVPPQ
ncbi:hypothetical protein N0V85_001808 [Neurospora sp. IMI 360204]|nr:hypothetical protein N0V85_001808 [Neurospora sp. IMI 360204]